jgi:hypothetical protein
MSGIVVNELVTRFVFQTQKSGIKQYEANLKRLDKLGQHVGNRAGHGFQQSLTSAAKNVRREFGAAFRDIQRQANGLRVRVQVDNSQAKARIKETEALAAGLARRLGSMAMSVGGGAMALNAGRDFAKTLTETVGTKQSNMGRLTTQMGGEAQAKQIYNWLRQFAEVTPFEKNELISGFSTIKGSGYQLTEADMRGLGDVTSGSKKTFHEMIEMLKSANRGLGQMVDNFDGMKATSEDGKIQMERFDKQLGVWVKETFEAGDMAGLVRFVRTHGERNYQGEMGRQSKTIPGLLSTVRDRLTSRFEDMGDAGMEQSLTGIMERAVKFMGDLEPHAKRFGKRLSEITNEAIRFYDKGIKHVPGVLKEIKHLAPVAAAALGLIGSHILGGKIIAAAKGLWGMAKAARALSLAQIGMSGLPLLIGGTVIGLGALGYHLATTGETGKLFKEEFDKLKPTLKEVWGDIQALGKELMDDLGPIAQDVFKNQIVPAVKAGLEGFRDFMKDWRAGYKELKETILPGLAEGIKSFGGDCVHWFENAKNTVNLFTEALDELINKWKFFDSMPLVGPLKHLVEAGQKLGLFGGGNKGPQGSGPGGESANLGAGFSSAAGARLSEAAKNIRTELGYCLWDIKKTLTAVYGNYKGPGAMSVAGFKGTFAPGGSAKDFGPTLQSYYKMRKTKVGSLDELPDGAFAVYQPGIISNNENGHIEVYDKETRSFNFGIGPVAEANRRNAIRYADIYVPTDPGQQNVSMAPYGNNTNPGRQPLLNGNGMINLPPITQNFYGQQNAHEVKTAVKLGLAEVLTSVGGRYSQAAPRR